MERSSNFPRKSRSWKSQRSERPRTPRPGELREPSSLFLLGPRSHQELRSPAADVPLSPLQSPTGSETAGSWHRGSRLETTGGSGIRPRLRSLSPGRVSGPWTWQNARRRQERLLQRRAAHSNGRAVMVPPPHPAIPTVMEVEQEQEEEEEEVPPFSFKALPREKKVLLLSICVTHFFIMCSQALLNPLLPPQATKWGISSSTQGWIYGVYALGQFLISPVYGKFMPMMGAKFTFISGSFLAAGATILWGVLGLTPTQESSLPVMTLCFLLEIILALAVSAVEMSAIVFASVHFLDNITFVVGLTELFVGLGMTFGPFIGGSLNDLGGFYLPFLVVGLAIMLTIPINLWWIPPAEELARSEKDVARLMLRRPMAWLLLLATCLTGAVWAFLDPTLEPHLEEFSITSTQVGLMFLLLSAAYSFSSVVTGGLAERLSDSRYLMIVGFVFIGLGQMLLGPSPVFQLGDLRELWLDALGLFIMGAGMGLAIIPTYDLLTDLADEIFPDDDAAVYGPVGGMWMASYSLGEFLGPVWGGWALETVGFQWGLSIMALPCFLLAVLMVVLVVMDMRCCAKSGGSGGDLGEKTPLTSSLNSTVHVEAVQSRERAAIAECFAHSGAFLANE